MFSGRIEAGLSKERRDERGEGKRSRSLLPDASKLEVRNRLHFYFD